VNSGEQDDRLNRAQGALLGLVVGDALGTTLEFTARDSKPLVTELVGGGPFGLPPGVWTDDTSMALCLAESLIANSGFNPVDVMNRFVGWWRWGESSPIGRCFDIGTTTASALRRFIDTGEPFAGDPSPQSAGNGSLMRLAPVVVFASGDDAALDRLARQQSQLTHAAPEAIDACALYASLISAALMGGSRHELLSPRPWSGTPAIAAIARGDWRGKERAQIASSGYVVHTLEAALWCIGRHDGFEASVTEAANLADDADTVAATTGQLAGALWGASTIPTRWLEKLAWREKIGQIAMDLLGASPAGASKKRAALNEG